jgi:hypothetical protein
MEFSKEEEPRTPRKQIVNEDILNAAIIIQKYVKIYILKNKCTRSELQTKEWRQSKSWYIDGKRNECEIYQREIVEGITGQECPKTKERINIEKNDIISEPKPMTREDAFDWTEDFDGKQHIDGYNLYYNLKMVIGSGGAQTRSLREVAHFIKAQLDYNIAHITNISYFINILDGDQSYKLDTQFYYILNKKKYKYVKNFVYIGDIHGFIDWFNQLNLQ